MTCQEIYEAGLRHHIHTDTPYPPTSKSFVPYRLTDKGNMAETIRMQWQSCDELCLCIHIPFRQNHGSSTKRDDKEQNDIVDLLLTELSLYAPFVQEKKLVGYDLCGAPCMLSTQHLQRITENVVRYFSPARDVAFSVETTALDASQEAEKLVALYGMGYRRISIRHTASQTPDLYGTAMDAIRAAGFERCNIDVPYGAPQLQDVIFERKLQDVITCAPEYVTLRCVHAPCKTSVEKEHARYKALYQYRLAQRILSAEGYHANRGKSVFSNIPWDYGTSDCQTAHIINATPCLGIGPGALSIGPEYCSCNAESAEGNMEQYRNVVKGGSLPVQDLYLLPREEVMAYTVVTALRFAFIDLDAFKRRFGTDLSTAFPEAYAFIEENNCMERTGTRLMLTERGADAISGIIPLFYSTRVQEELLSAPNETDSVFSHEKDREARSIVAVDVAAFALRKHQSDNYKQDASAQLCLLLVRRDGLPFMDCWALPGGFLRETETVTRCTVRHIREQLNATPTAIMPAGTFSEPGRDPRGRVVSNAFAVVIAQDDAQTVPDTEDSRWFTVSKRTKGRRVFLELHSDDIHLRAVLAWRNEALGEERFSLVESDGIALDHAAIIAEALSAIQKAAEHREALFAFLPATFTLSALQQAQETLTGEHTQSANFRRKMATFVEAAEGCTSGAGHRPAQLFRRKKETEKG